MNKFWASEIYLPAPIEGEGVVLDGELTTDVVDEYSSVVLDDCPALFTLESIAEAVDLVINKVLGPVGPTVPFLFTSELIVVVEAEAN